VASEFSYRKDEEIYGEDELAEYVYQVIRGAVRTYKLLSDGRRQIGAFLLPGDVFGLESGTSHRLAAEAVIDTTVRLVKRSSLDRPPA
jgi:cAMP-binding proteins - catabolite gene activator and regulatory subunit of cAMP-dependent protein kinases